MQLSIKVDFAEVMRKLETLPKEIESKVLASALNKTVAKAKTQMAREITAEYRVSASYVKDRLTIKKATAAAGRMSLTAELMGSGRNGRSRSANLIAFVESFVTPAQSRKRAKGVDANQLRFQVRKTGGKKIIRGAFIGNKGRTMFIRTGDKRLPIKALSTIDVPSMFNQRRINARVVAAIQSDFPRIFDNDAKFFTDKFNAK